MKRITRRKKVLGCLGVIAVLFVAWWWTFLVPPKVMREVEGARDGNPLNAKVAVVFSANYDICLGGVESFYHFDIHKYANIYKQLVAVGLLKPEDVFVPEEVSKEDLLLVHTKEYLARLQDSSYVARYLEFDPVAWMPASVVDSLLLRGFRHCTGGTLLASRLALKYGIGINLGGGYHHARPDRGGGFCIYADVPIAVRRLQKEGRIKRALLVDLDTHQGDGSAVCFVGDSDVFTFSIHEENIYPVPKAKSDLDIGLEPGVDDERYMKVLRQNLPRVIDRARPDIVYLLGGTDVYIGDRLGHLKITTRGMLARDMCVVKETVSRGIPFVMVTSGGYCPKSWELHFNSIRKIIETYGTAKKEKADAAEQ